MRRRPKKEGEEKSWAWLAGSRLNNNVSNVPSTLKIKHEKYLNFFIASLSDCLSVCLSVRQCEIIRAEASLISRLMHAAAAADLSPAAAILGARLQSFSEE